VKRQEQILREFLARAYEEASLPLVAIDVRNGNRIDWVREKVALRALELVLDQVSLEGKRETMRSHW
jgi:hypothetical protein